VFPIAPSFIPCPSFALSSSLVTYITTPKKEEIVIYIYTNNFILFFFIWDFPQKGGNCYIQKFYFFVINQSMMPITKGKKLNFWGLSQL
jgi:hypothetical protein